MVMLFTKDRFRFLTLTSKENVNIWTCAVKWAKAGFVLCRILLCFSLRIGFVLCRILLCFSLRIGFVLCRILLCFSLRIGFVF